MFIAHLVELLNKRGNNLEWQREKKTNRERERERKEDKETKIERE